MPSIIEKIYNKDTYFKKYGTSIFGCIIFIFILILIITFCNIWKKRNDIRNDWINQRCNPSIFPFAGFINAPENVSIVDFTLQNFTQCVQNQVETTTAIGTQPLNVITSGLASIYSLVSDCILSIVEMIAYLRDSLTNFFNSVFQLLLNYLIPFQQINFAIFDILKRTAAMLYTIVMIFVAIVGSIKDMFGSLIQIFLSAYIILIALFVSLLFFIPGSLLVLVPLSIVMLAILAIIVILGSFYSDVFGGLPPYIPSFKGLCFGKNTILKLKNNKKVKIQNVKLGSILEDGSIVKAKIKLSAKNIPMYNLNGVIVSDSHYVSLTANKIHEENNWIQVKKHLLSKRVVYTEPCIYCLSTSSKKIKINDMYFLDWDDMTPIFYHLFKDKHKMNKLLKGYSKHKKIDCDSFQKSISQVKINDKIKKAKVIGKVKILKNKNVKYNIITDTEYFYSNQIKHQDFYDLINNL
jgi:hypothetical protein